MPTTLIRRSPARVLFLQHVAAHGPVTKVHPTGPIPSVDSILDMERAGLITIRDVHPHQTKRGTTAHTLEFTITDVGRAWLAEHASEVAPAPAAPCA